MMPFFMPAGISTTCRTSSAASWRRWAASATELMTSSAEPEVRARPIAISSRPRLPERTAQHLDLAAQASRCGRRRLRRRIPAGRDKLLALQQAAGVGQAVFERRADNLQALLDRIANDEGSDSAVIDQHIIEKAGDLFDIRADDIFYFNKGRLYANYLILRELAATSTKRHPRTESHERLETAPSKHFGIAAALDPWIV